MKSKTKKILAGLALGVVGASALTGCAMTDEQQAVLDKVVSKTDELVDLIDKNMQYQNSQITKEEAVEKLLIAMNMSTFAKFDQFKMEADGKLYNGVYDYLMPEDKWGKLEYFYKRGEDYKYSVLIQNDTICEFTKSNFKTNNHYEYGCNADVEYFREVEYSSSMWCDNLLDNTLLFTKITSDDIVNINVIDNGYEFDVCYLEFLGDSVVDIYDITIKMVDNKIVSQRVNDICYEFPEGALTEFKDENGGLTLSIYDLMNNVDTTNLKVSTGEYVITYKYNNIDFTNIDAKFAEIEGQYLTEE